MIVTQIPGNMLKYHEISWCLQIAALRGISDYFWRQNWGLVAKAKPGGLHRFTIAPHAPSWRLPGKGISTLLHCSIEFCFAFWLVGRCPVSWKCLGTCQFEAFLLLDPFVQLKRTQTVLNHSKLQVDFPWAMSFNFGTCTATTYTDHTCWAFQHCCWLFCIPYGLSAQDIMTIDSNGRKAWCITCILRSTESDPPLCFNVFYRDAIFFGHDFWLFVGRQTKTSNISSCIEAGDSGVQL